MGGDPFYGKQPDRSVPSRKYRPLVYADISDDNDLSPLIAKSLRVYNGSASAVTLMCIAPDDKDAAFPTPFTVPAGMSETLNFGARRIKATGSTGLITGGAITTGVQVQIAEL